MVCRASGQPPGRVTFGCTVAPTAVQAEKGHLPGCTRLKEPKDGVFEDLELPVLLKADAPVLAVLQELHKQGVHEIFSVLQLGALYVLLVATK